MPVALRRIHDEGVAIPTEVVWMATTQVEGGLRGPRSTVPAARPELGISSRPSTPP